MTGPAPENQVVQGAENPAIGSAPLEGGIITPYYTAPVGTSYAAFYGDAVGAGAGVAMGDFPMEGEVFGSNTDEEETAVTTGETMVFGDDSAPAVDGANAVDNTARIKGNLPSDIGKDPEAGNLHFKLGDGLREPSASELLDEDGTAKFSTVDDPAKADIIFNKDGSITLNTNISKPLSAYKIYTEKGAPKDVHDKFLGLLGKSLKGEVEGNSSDLTDTLKADVQMDSVVAVVEKGEIQ